MVHGITYIFAKIHVKVFEAFIRNARTDRYNLMCSIDAHEKNAPEKYDGINIGRNPIRLNSTTEAIVSLSVTIEFIGCWMRGIEHTFLECFNMYLKIPV